MEIQPINNILVITQIICRLIYVISVIIICFSTNKTILTIFIIIIFICTIMLFCGLKDYNNYIRHNNWQKKLYTLHQIFCIISVIFAFMLSGLIFSDVNYKIIKIICNLLLIFMSMMFMTFLTE
jgi:NADH:ubiquinone oxidoreductase subunit 2 (subunit N)